MSESVRECEPVRICERVSACTQCHTARLSARDDLRLHELTPSPCMFAGHWHLASSSSICQLTVPPCQFQSDFFPLSFLSTIGGSWLAGQCAERLNQSTTDQQRVQASNNDGRRREGTHSHARKPECHSGQLGSVWRTKEEKRERKKEGKEERRAVRIGHLLRQVSAA